MPESMQDRITNLLQRASDAHHEYEVAVLNGVRDEEWEQWYAAWLIEHGINDLLNSDMQGSDLADLLREINAMHQQTDQQKSWAQYTAERLIDTVS
ncbi:MAG: hypothetical protein DIU68_019910 [Chloroflexota bacterium]|nr:MAG: hypothetical protein DIU68_20115 [Chloroflexota bacterium]